jgi:hypothetical protein
MKNSRIDSIIVGGSKRNRGEENKRRAEGKRVRKEEAMGNGPQEIEKRVGKQNHIDRGDKTIHGVCACIGVRSNNVCDAIPGAAMTSSLQAALAT